ncbi:protein of unknown function [endosymbiont DhMRE of Dentiscutata heterogama]|uniref:hypothetical protein n=1 Tax=endosymbiont DhMRE of Dentiscutata heterogama TaxID=1609546 RepID=UPI000629D555|nr:hypothetical protein [endosymbiont DhMRE of Dentiscutata heterogama]CFW93043.1 protein of unknown function [endosymbiont DhMRE of Dentiscutata heterogama]
MENWERYLENLTDNEKIQKFVKRIKIAIIQQNNKNNQRVANLPLDEAKQATQNEIQELLQKHQIELSRLDKSSWGNEESWQEYLAKLTDSQEIANFARKMREAIMRQSLLQEKNDNKSVSNKPASSPWPIILVLFLLLIVVGMGVVLIVSRRRLKRGKVN